MEPDQYSSRQAPQLLPTATAVEESARDADIAVLPIGSFEQHSSHLPLSTDTLVACVVARQVAAAYDLMLLPPITISCSHEHAGWRGTVSISAATLYAVVKDVAASLRSSGVQKLLIVSGHGGNYVLAHIAQEASIEGRDVAIFPDRLDWKQARIAAGMAVLDGHEDMHAGELETSILLHAYPEVVRDSYRASDHVDDDGHRHLLTTGLRAYSASGVLGRPSLATADKGAKALVELTTLAAGHVDLLRSDQSQEGRGETPG
jgi:creatinine amidohydrolase